MLPSATEMLSFASIASAVQLMLIVPPVIFISSLPDIPLSVELMLSVPSPFSTMSSFEKITASVLVSPSAVKLPDTVRVFSEPFAVVTNTLSAFFT